MENIYILLHIITLKNLYEQMIKLLCHVFMLSKSNRSQRSWASDRN